MPPEHEPEDSAANAPDPKSAAKPERVLEALRLRHGASRYAARRRLPLVKRALRASPELRARLLSVVDAALAWDAAEARRARGEPASRELSERGLDERWLCALAPLLERW
jgi:hypothetical protein